jgi:DNA-binding response OmpR family regulator
MEHQLKVLLIEDNDGDAFLMKFYLGDSVNYKFDLVHTKTLAGAYEQMLSQTYDIVLMDLNLPDSIGLDSIKAFIDKFPGSLVVVLTGLIDERIGFDAVKFGAQDFLVKGKFDSKLLISSVIYSFERFNLNKKIRNVSTQLSDGQIRFDNLQHLANIGYFELDFTTNKFFVSKHAAHVLGLGDVTNMSVEEALEKFIDKSSFDEAIEEIRAGATKGERIFYNRILDRELFVRWEQLNGVFAAIVYY